jgi:hypothetical protein
MTTRSGGLALLFLLTVALSACTPREQAPPTPPEPELHVTARLISPTDVVVESSGHSPHAAGHIVEFATDPKGDWTTLAYMLPAEMRHHHPNVVPETTFYYRVRELYGAASSPVGMAMPEPPKGEDIDADPHDWAEPKRLPMAAAVETHPIQVEPAAAAKGAPTDLKGVVKHSKGIHFTWTDRASDELGYLLESRPEGAPDFRVVALIDRDMNSFGLITLPNEKRAAFRIRAFYFGRPSNTAKATSGPEQPTPRPRP